MNVKGEFFMPRGLLPDEVLNDIGSGMPNPKKLNEKKRKLNIDIINLVCGPHSNIQIAANCLDDAINLLADSRMALFECYAHGRYYRDFKEQPSEITANYMEQFFLDDLSFRLYASAENLANAILFIFEVSDSDLEPYRTKRSSNQSIVGHYLIDKKSGHPITNAIKQLANSEDWKLSMNYRNRLVHEQPPTIEGLGLVYQRRSRWEKGENGSYSLGLGGSDTPEYSTVQVREFLEKGFSQLIDATETIIDYYIEILQNKGISFS